jgi:hypothetical protein
VQHPWSQGQWTEIAFRWVKEFSSPVCVADERQKPTTDLPLNDSPDASLDLNVNKRVD